MVNINEINQEAKIEYPTNWEYKVIVDKDYDINNICKEVLNDKEFKLEKSNSSSSGKYESYLVSTNVNDKKERLDIFAKFKEKAKFVL